MNLKRAIGGPLLALVFLIFFVYVISGVQWVLGNSTKDQKDEILLGSISSGPQITEPQNLVENTVLPITMPDVVATAAISIESNLQDVNKIVFEKNSNAVLPIASLTKLMTAVIVIDNYNLTDMAVVSSVADSQDPVKQDVKLGDKMSVEIFLDIMLVGSSNKAAYALAEKMGVEKFVGIMNQEAKKLGLQNTFFADPTGLSPQNVSSASDLAKLAEYILKNYPKIANISKVEKFYVSGFGTIINTDQLLAEISEINLSKTGFTNEAKGCLLLIINNQKSDDYLINVVLGAEDRFSEMKKIINWVNATSK